MYSVRRSLQEDPVRTLKEVAGIGYRYLEFANLVAENDPGCGFGMDAKDLNNILTEYGLRSVSCHLMPLDDENLKRVIDYHTQIGTKYLIAKLKEPYVDAEKAKVLAEAYDHMGKIVKEHGMRLCYYPRFFDYSYQFDGCNTLLESIMNNTDPRYVDLEIDVYWLYRWGKDPTEIMKQYGDRIKLMHIKDMSRSLRGKTGPLEIGSGELKQVIDEIYSYSDKFFDPSYFTEIGSGILDIHKYIADSERYTEAEYNFLEQDGSDKTELESIKLSLSELKKYDNVEF